MLGVVLVARPERDTRATTEASLATRAEGMARTDPLCACVYARISLEAIVGWLYRADRSPTPVRWWISSRK